MTNKTTKNLKSGIEELTKTLKEANTDNPLRHAHAALADFAGAYVADEIDRPTLSALRNLVEEISRVLSKTK